MTFDEKVKDVMYGGGGNDSSLVAEVGCARGRIALGGNGECCITAERL